MGKRGPPKLPDTIKLLRGTYRKAQDGDPDSKPAPKALVAMKPPEWLGKDGRAAWSRESSRLVELGVLTEIDVSAFSMYCRCFDEIAWCDKILEEQGHFFTAQSGYIGQHPAVNQRFKWIDLKRRYEAEFGLTPSSRSGVLVNKPKASGVMKRERA
jgi:P27 family predicted phage terminase small subunit